MMDFFYIYATIDTLFKKAKLIINNKHNIMFR